MQFLALLMGIECVPSEPMNEVKQSSLTYTAGKDIQTDMNIKKVFLKILSSTFNFHNNSMSKDSSNYIKKQTSSISR